MPEHSDDKVPLSADYVPEGTYPPEVCVLRYALECNARERPNKVYAAFEGGERWTFADTLENVVAMAGNLHALGVRQGDHVVLVLPTSPLARPLPWIFSSIRRFRRNVVTLLSRGVSTTDMKTIRFTPSARHASRRLE